MKPTWRALQGASLASDSPEMTLLSMVIVPEVGRSRPAIRFKSVDFPDPEGPIRAMKSPFSRTSWMSFKTGICWDSRRYVLETCSMRITAWLPESARGFARDGARGPSVSAAEGAPPGAETRAWACIDASTGLEPGRFPLRR